MREGDLGRGGAQDAVPSRGESAGRFGVHPLRRGLAELREQEGKTE
ncbi:hypothetical protein ABZ860_34300 [Microbispora sp. NPDC046973]